MKNRITLLLLMLLPIFLFADTSSLSFYIQTDDELTAQTIIENENSFFEKETTLLAKTVLTDTILWIKSTEVDQTYFDLLLKHNKVAYKKFPINFYRIEYPSLALLVSLGSISEENTSNSLPLYIYGDAFYYGVMLTLLLYSWFFYSFLQHISFRYYLYFHLSFIILLLFTDGWVEKIMGLDKLSAQPIIALELQALSMFLMILFSRRLLATKTVSKYLDRILLFFALLNILSMPFILLVSQEFMMPVVMMLAFAVSLILLGNTIYLLLSSKPLYQKFYLLFWAILLVGIGIEYLRYLDILPSNLFTLFALKTAIFLELLIVPLALTSNRISYLEKDNKEIETHLMKSENKLFKKDLDQERLQQKHDLLNKLAGIDSLTGLYNRREFFNTSESLIFGAKNALLPYALMMLDLDYFKNVNDTYGHDVGDIVLKEVAKAINEHKRSDDIFGRIGGEEFAIFMPNVDAKEAERLANELCTLVGKLKIETETQSIPITVSIGVTSDINYISTLSELMKSSDIALYEAKEKGRNCVVSVEVLPR